MELTQMLDQTFQRIGLGESEAEVYSALLEFGTSTAGNLAKKINVPRSSLYGFLSTLAERGLVSQSEDDGVKLWFAESPERILSILDREIDQWGETKTRFNKFLPDLLARQAVDFTTPRFRYFEGSEGVKNILKDMLLYRDIVTEAFWPIRSMVDILGEEFFEYFNIHRIRQRIYTKAIWPADRVLDIRRFKFLGVGEEFCREIRRAPKGIDCSMGYWAYHNKVAFISSRSESFGFIVESRELKDMLAAQFSVTWGVSTPIEVDLEDTMEFLRKV